MKVKFIYVHVLVGMINFCNYGRYIQIRYSSAICISQLLQYIESADIK